MAEAVAEALLPLTPGYHEDDPEGGPITRVYLRGRAEDDAEVVTQVTDVVYRTVVELPRCGAKIVHIDNYVGAPAKRATKTKPAQEALPATTTVTEKRCQREEGHPVDGDKEWHVHWHGSMGQQWSSMVEVETRNW